MYRSIITLLEHEQFRHFLWAPVFLAAGIGIYFSLPTEPNFILTACLLIFSSFLSAAIWRQTRQFFLALPILLIALGFSAAHVETTRINTPMLVKDVGFTTIQATISDIEAMPKGRRIWLKDVTTDKEDVPALKLIRLIDQKQAADISIGQRVEWRAFLRAVTEPILLGGYDFRRHAFFGGIGATGFVVGVPTILNQTPSDSSDIFASERLQVQQKISSILEGDRAAIGTALLTGSQNGISETTMEEMRLSGLTHILSVSGLHIGLAAGILFFLIRAGLALIPGLALRYPIKKWAAALSWFGALAYTLFVGAPVPAVRSLLMITLALLAIIVDRTALSLRVVALSAAAILLIVPHALLTPSFQLSFAAITAIIGLYEIIERQRGNLMAGAGFIKRGLIALGMIAVTSIAASIATAPLTHYHFQQLQGYGVLSNMIAIPLTSFWIMPAAVISFAAMPFGLEQCPIKILGQGIEWLMQIAQWAANLPGAGWQPAALPFPALMLMTIGGLWLLIWQMKWRWAGLIPIAAGIVIAFFPTQPKALISSDGHFVAVKQGEDYVLLSDSDRRKEDGFVPDEWRQWLGVKSYASAQPYCSSSYCKIDDLYMVRDQNWLPDICQPQRHVIYANGILKNCSMVDIDRRFLRREGALMIGDDNHIKTTRDDVGARPWTRHKNGEKED